MYVDSSCNNNLHGRIVHYDYKAWWFLSSEKTFREVWHLFFTMKLNRKNNIRVCNFCHFHLLAVIFDIICIQIFPFCSVNDYDIRGMIWEKRSTENCWLWNRQKRIVRRWCEINWLPCQLSGTLFPCAQHTTMRAVSGKTGQSRTALLNALYAQATLNKKLISWHTIQYYIVCIIWKTMRYSAKGKWPTDTHSANKWWAAATQLNVYITIEISRRIIESSVSATMTPFYWKVMLKNRYRRVRRKHFLLLHSLCIQTYSETKTRTYQFLINLVATQSLPNTKIQIPGCYLRMMRNSLWLELSCAGSHKHLACIWVWNLRKLFQIDRLSVCDREREFYCFSW